VPHCDRDARDGFIAELNRVWTLAGPPSYADFRKLSMQVKGPAEAGAEWLSRSTTQDILAGRRRRPPKWRWVARFITVLRVAAEEAGVDPGRIGTLAEWKHKHEIACAATTADQRLVCAAGNQALASDFAGRPREAAYASPRAASLLLDGKGARRDPDLAELLRTAGQDWWCDYGDLVPAWLCTYLSLEPAAHLIRAYEPMLVPGWLQTEAYAAAAIRLTRPDLGRLAIKRLVELRMRRQELLNRRDGARQWVIVEETAVRRRLGSVKAMRTQIKHLIEVSEQTSITIQVIPVDTKVHAIAGGPITFLRFPSSRLPDVVYLEQLTGALYLLRSDDVAHYMGVLSALGVQALQPASTRDFLREILMEL
jgi:hypothetical protein